MTPRGNGRERGPAGPLRLAALLLLSMAASGEGRAAQPDDVLPAQTLRARVEARYIVGAISNGIVLVPRAGTPGGVIELADGRVAIDGVERGGGGLDALGPAARLVRQLASLEPDARRRLFGLEAAATTASPPDRVERLEAEAQPGRWRAGGYRRRGGWVRIGRDVDVEASETVAGPVIVIFGSARIAGTVEEDVVAIGGDVRLEPDARVFGDITSILGTIERAPGAVSMGGLHEIGLTALPIRFRVLPFGWWFDGWQWLAGAALVLTSIRLMVTAALALLAGMIAPATVGRIGDRLGAAPLQATLTGFVAELAILPALIVTVVGLTISILGIPLLALVPFAVLLLMAVMVVGFAGAAGRLGRWSPFGSGRSVPGAVLVGLCYVFALTFLARLGAVVGGPIRVAAFATGAAGFLFECLVWTMGFGAALLTWLDGRGVLRTALRTESPAPASTAGTNLPATPA
jgi:hypothetical protein